MNARAIGLLIGYAADRSVGDPQRYHPVAGFGRTARALERRVYADSRARGVAHTALLVGSAVAGGVLAERSGNRPTTRAAVTAVATWVVLGGRSLERAAEAVHVRLAAGDLPGAREQLTSLVGRDTSHLDSPEISRAVIESVAENTSDAVVAPLLWGAVAGVPGLLGYRAANTLDAMVGHRSARYERYGWASARLDDLINLPASRLSGALTIAVEPSHARQGWHAWRRDAGLHPSPNAGVVEAAFAGVLGIHLGGTNRYGTRVEHRAVMGDGRAPRLEDIGDATHLARRIGHGAVVAAAVLSVGSSRLRWPPTSLVSAGRRPLR